MEKQNKKKAKFGVSQCLENDFLGCLFLDWESNKMTEI